MSPLVMVVVGMAAFVVALGSGIASDSTWHDVMRPGVILPALGQVAGMVLTFFGAKRMPTGKEQETW